MNTAALRLATGRSRSYRRWNVTGHGNGNVLTIAQSFNGLRVRWPVGPNLLIGSFLPVPTRSLSSRTQVKAALRDFLDNHATTF